MRVDEQSQLQFLGSRSAGANAALAIDTRQNFPRRGGKPAHLPLFARAADRRQRGNESSMDKGDFAADQLRGDNIIEFLDLAKNLMRARMRPPRSRHDFARDDADGAGQFLVLQQKEAVPGECALESQSDSSVSRTRRNPSSISFGETAPALRRNHPLSFRRPNAWNATTAKPARSRSSFRISSFVRPAI